MRGNEVYSADVRRERRTICGVLLYNLHNTDNTGGLAVGVVEKGLVSLLHVAHKVSSC